MSTDRVRDKIPLHSTEGQEMVGGTAIRQTLLMRLFREQVNNTFCGIQSAALVMSARHLGQKFPDPTEQSDCDIGDVPYREENMYSFEETRMALDFETADSKGATLLQAHDIIRAHRFPVRKIHADESSEEEFRALASDALSQVDSKKGVIVNYDEYDLGQDDHVHGHFSLLAAYHEASDRFLLLDTWFNTTDCWVKTGDLFRCMNTFDSDADRFRGFLIVG